MTTQLQFIIIIIIIIIIIKLRQQNSQYSKDRLKITDTHTSLQIIMRHSKHLISLHSSVFCFVPFRNIVYHIKEVRRAESIWEKCTEENTWTEEGRNVTRFEKKYGMILKPRFSKIDQYANVIFKCDIPVVLYEFNMYSVQLAVNPATMVTYKRRMRSHHLYDISAHRTPHSLGYRKNLKMAKIGRNM